MDTTRKGRTIKSAAGALCILGVLGAGTARAAPTGNGLECSGASRLVSLKCAILPEPGPEHRGRPRAFRARCLVTPGPAMGFARGLVRPQTVEEVLAGSVRGLHAKLRSTSRAPDGSPRASMLVEDRGDGTGLGTLSFETESGREVRGLPRVICVAAIPPTS